MYSKEHINYLKKEKRKKVLVHITQITILIVVLLIWEYLSQKELINPFIYSSPSKVIKTIISLYKSNNLFNHIFITIYETFISFMLATLIGTLVAIILWFNKFLYKVFDPYLTIINSMPKVALGPIIIILAGANQKSIIIMALLISTIITIINMYQSFILTDENKIKLLKSFKATKWQIYKYLIIPHSFSNIISTIKINISMSLVGLLPPVGENFIV